jgi:hypothetical protein
MLGGVEAINIPSQLDLRMKRSEEYCIQPELGCQETVCFNSESSMVDGSLAMEASSDEYNNVHDKQDMEIVSEEQEEEGEGEREGEMEEEEEEYRETEHMERGNGRLSRGPSKERQPSWKDSRPSTPPPVEIPKPDGTERGQFLHDLYSFMQRIGQPITKTPQLGYQELDLYRLYQIVVARGGMDEVTRRQEWKIVYSELGIPTMSTSASYNTRTNYKKHLYLYELEHGDFNDRRPTGKEPAFQVGDYVRIVSSNYAGQVFYAKILKCRWRNMKNMYYVHYNGWSTSHDEWMPEMVISDLLKEEQKDPERYLKNPHPNRSSKSNHIIGEQPPEYKARALRAKPTKSEDSGDDEFANYQPSTPRKELPLFSQKKAIKGKLRGEVASSEAVSTGPNLSKVQAEMEKLEAERILEYVPPKKLRFITAENAHRHGQNRTVPGFKSALLETVDLRVPNVKDIVGSMIPFTSPVKTTMEKTVMAVDKRESISVMERALREIKKEYKIKKRLFDLYYGSSSESGSSESTTSSNNNEATSLSVASPRRTRRAKS